VAFLDDVVGRREADVDLVRVQVLNGNGVPGIGQEVAERLVGSGFKVILSGNARRLDYEHTRIITYDSSAEGLTVAERARDLLTVGRVQVSAQQQGIVDLTIVVGMDFLETR
jgi:polyisoprenyl-teichoic acid--peptidoglycan teichoic acid transferase